MTVEVAINGKAPTGRSQRKEGGWYGIRNCVAKSESNNQDEKNFAPGPRRAVRSGLHHHGPKWNGRVQLEIGIQDGELKRRLSECHGSAHHRALPAVGHESFRHVVRRRRSLNNLHLRCVVAEVHPMNVLPSEAEPGTGCATGLVRARSSERPGSDTAQIQGV